MNILDKIIIDKKREVILKKSIIPVKQLNHLFFFEKDDSLRTNLINSTSGIIAEHKRRSPSKAEINYSFTVEEVNQGYEDAGAWEFQD
jgi:indole-3-glycerol phosphate synthase